MCIDKKANCAVHPVEGIPFSKLLDIDVKHSSEQNIVLETVITEKHMNSLGITHGGALISFAVTAMEMIASKANDKLSLSHIDVNFLRPVDAASRLKTVAAVSHRDSHTVLVESHISDEKEQLVLKVCGTFLSDELC
ncbi:MAG: PaaI family thioesterase [Negativicutes bacterium]|nr:PaaI family thioesterase [Negativicutes bacterium]